jgi:hypothetical protein
MTDTNRDALIFEKWVEGERVRDIAAVFKCGTDVVLQTIDKYTITIDDDFRRRLVSREIERLEHLHRTFFDKAKGGDATAGTLCLRIAERFASLVGLDAAQKLDVTQVMASTETSTDRIEAAIRRIQHDPLYGGDGKWDEEPEPPAR